MSVKTEIRTPPLDAPEGTCEPVTDHAPWWFVKGSREWHVVSATTGECDCGAWVFKCAYTRNLCKHGRFLERHLTALAACPYCRGKGWLVPTLPYVTRRGEPDREPLPCVICGGTGKRSEDEASDEAGAHRVR